MAKHFIHKMAKMGGLENKQILDLTAELSDMNIENDLKRQVEGYEDIQGYEARSGIPGQGTKD
ncbi:hypothetical protein MMC10_010123 [Thelotrema lepadinum]|nr:hypothetical protein [Thelotrema lepadinum]